MMNPPNAAMANSAGFWNITNTCDVISGTKIADRIFIASR